MRKGRSWRIRAFQRGSAVVLFTAALAQGARAQPATPDPEPALDEPPAEAPVEERMQTLEQRLDQLERAFVRHLPRLTLSGFVDVGFFAVQGDGTGFVQDVGLAASRRYPEYADRFAWVFLGDLLSTPVNTRGDPADLGNPPGIQRADGVASRGAPGFIANEVNLRLSAAVADAALATASVSFAPRSGQNFSSGDAFEVELAQLEWMLGDARRTSIFVGKIDPVIGIEYRQRKSDRRFGITPSLIARYTTGTPLGLKVRSKLGESEWLILAAAVTNGSSGIESFHFYDEIDSNAGKTGSARIALAPPLSSVFQLELGGSGEYGPQDHALDSRHALWFVGADLQMRLYSFDLRAEWLHGAAPGEVDQVYDDPHRPWGLRLHSGGYAELDWRATGRLGFLVRAEHRDALVWLGNPAAPTGGDRMYVTKVWRATGGARLSLSDWIVLKVEYLHNGEYGRLPNIRNDVFTSSLVLVY
jgi:hypothetical protein